LVFIERLYYNGISSDALMMRTPHVLSFVFEDLIRFFAADQISSQNVGRIAKHVEQQQQQQQQQQHRTQKKPFITFEPLVYFFLC
jgi:hypothetical protein